MKGWLYLLFFCCCAGAVFSQNKLSGRVINAVTKEPVPFANVFFANTTIGMSTREDGTFSLSGFPNGKYDITVTSVGFRQLQKPIDFTIPHKQVVEILINEDTRELEEVVVKEDNPNRENDFRMFTNLFIGETPHAEKCTIGNPGDIHLYFDPETREFTAHARKPIEIINQAMGLRIFYHLNSFDYNYKTGVFVITGIPQIQYLTPKSKAEERKWIKERKDAYHGSVMHFMRALFRDSLAAAGFSVRKVYSVPNRERIPQAAIDAGIKKYRAVTSSHFSVNDSLSYFLKMKNKPEMRDSVAPEVLAAHDLVKDASVAYHGKLQIVYEKEKEDWAYVKTQRRSIRINQTSQIHLIGNQPLLIYSNGYYENPTDVFLEYYWSWDEKIASLLPLDYEPEKDIPHFNQP